MPQKRRIVSDSSGQDFVQILRQTHSVLCSNRIDDSRRLKIQHECFSLANA